MRKVLAFVVFCSVVAFGQANPTFTGTVSINPPGTTGVINIGTGSFTVGVTSPVTNGVAVADPKSCPTPNTLNAACINALLASNKRIYVPAGSWTLNGTVLVSGLHDVDLEFDQAAIMAPGTATVQMLEVIGSNATHDIRVHGGQWDGGNTCCSNGIIFETDSGGVSGPDRVEFDHMEVRNSNNHGIQISSTNPVSVPLVTNVTVNNNNVHDVTKSGILINKMTGGLVYANRMDSSTTWTGTSIGCLRSNGMQNVAIIDNECDHWPSGSDSAGFKMVFGSNVVSIGNMLRDGPINPASGGNGIWYDTIYGGSIMGNQILNHGNYGIRSEVSENITIQGNNIQGPDSYGIVVNSRDDVFQKAPWNTATGTCPGTNCAAGVTVTAVSTSPPAGAVNPAGVADTTYLHVTNSSSVAAGGILFYSDLGSVQNWITSNNPPVSMFWVRSVNALAAGTLSLSLAATANLTSIHSSIPLPQLPANKWIQLRIIDPLFGNKYDVPGVRTFGITVSSGNTLAISQTLDFVELDQDVPNRSITVQGNTVNHPQNDCYLISNVVSYFSVKGNICTDPGWQSAYSNYTMNAGILVAPGALGGSNNHGAGAQPVCVSACPIHYTNTAGVVEGNTIDWTNSITSTMYGIRFCTGSSCGNTGATIDQVRLGPNAVNTADYVGVTTGGAYDVGGATNYEYQAPFAQTGTSTLANAPTNPNNGDIHYFTDANPATNPCTSGGTGAFAVRQNGAWACK